MLVLTRRLRWNYVLPATLRSLQDKLMFWRRVPGLQWDWTTWLLLAVVLWILYRALTGHYGALTWFLLGLLVKDVHDDALPIFARVRIKDDEITLGRLFTEREPLKNVRHYRTSCEDQTEHAVQFALHKDDFTGCILFVVDKEDCERLIECLQARGIVDTNVYFEQ